MHSPLGDWMNWTKEGRTIINLETVVISDASSSSFVGSGYSRAAWLKVQSSDVGQLSVFWTGSPVAEFRSRDESRRTTEALDREAIYTP